MIQAITKNWSWKFGSLALSALIWLGMASDPTVATTISVPIQYKNVPRDLEMSNAVQEVVHLEIGGPSSKLTPENLTDTAVLLDLSGVQKPGERTFPVRASDISLPNGVQLQRAVPNQIRISFEERLRVEVPVRVRFAPLPPRGYEIVSQRNEPDQLTIVGPRSAVEQITSVETDPIDLSGVVGNQSFSVQTYIADPQVRFASDGHVTVRVQVRKIEQAEESN